MGLLTDKIPLAVVKNTLLDQENTPVMLTKMNIILSFKVAVIYWH